MPSLWIDTKGTFHLPIPYLDKKLQLQNTFVMSEPAASTFKPVQVWVGVRVTWINIYNKIPPCWIIFLTHSWPQQLNHFLIVQEEETSQSLIWENGLWKIESAVRTPAPEGTQDLTWEALEKKQGPLDQT